MTDEELARLPSTFAEIVRLDRKLMPMLKERVIPLFVAAQACKLRHRLRREADVYFKPARDGLA